MREIRFVCVRRAIVILSPIWIQILGGCSSDQAAEADPGLALPYAPAGVLTEVHCYGLHPWSEAGERHAGIDLKPPYLDLVGTPDVRKVEVVAPAAGVIDWIVRGESGADAEAWVVVIEINSYWYAVLVIEPQSDDAAIVAEQDASIDVQEAQRVRKGERIGDLVVGKVLESRYPHVHLSLLYKNPEDSIESLFRDPDPIVRSDGTALPPTIGPGSPWDPRNLGIPSTFFCPYVYSIPEAQQSMDGVPRLSVDGDLCSCVCAYDSQNGDCGVCP